MQKYLTIYVSPSKIITFLAVTLQESAYANIFRTFVRIITLLKSRNPILRLLAPAKPLVIWTLAVLAVTTFINLAAPVFSQVFVDSIITHKHPEWEAPVTILLVIILTVSVVNVFCGYYKKRALQAKYTVNQASGLFWHAIRLPVQAFGKMSPSDFILRLNNGNITFARLVAMLIPTLVSGVQILIMLVLMILYSPVLSLISLVSVIANVISLRMVASKQKSISRAMDNAQAEMHSTVAAGISNIEALKSAGAEAAFFRRTMDTFSNYINKSSNVSRSLVNLNFLPQFLQQATTIISLCLGAFFIIRGEMTVGLLLAFQGFLNQFLIPVSSLTRTNQLIMTASSAASRVLEVMDTPTDVSDGIELVPEDELSKLKGEIELRNVTFGYDRELPPLIENLSLHIAPGRSVAFVGGSGSGKSTLANLITGLYQPWSGEVLYDGKKKDEINRYSFYNSLSVVNQDIVLFDGTVADNIKMWDDVTEDFAMVLAARAAQIHSEIASRPEGYGSPVTGGGSNFSGGQRQRIEIATAIAKEPTIMVMDEATSALDPVTEMKVMESIREQGITTVIVAHRLSTIRDCDEILVIDHGRIADRGTHEELMQHTDGLYYKLMQMN